MYVQHYLLLAIIAATGQHLYSTAVDLPEDTRIVILDDSSYSFHQDNSRKNDFEIHNSLKPKGNSASQTPKSASQSRRPPTPPQSATVSTQTPFTVPTMPQPATATMSPGGNDLSKVTNLLFAILLVVTAILMVIAGVCLAGLRRRYLVISQPC